MKAGGNVMTVAAYVLPRTLRVERAGVMQAGPVVVFPLVVDLRQGTAWDGWDNRDLAMTISYAPATAGRGAWMERKSRAQDNGNVTCTKIARTTRLVYSLKFQDDHTGSTGIFLSSDATNGWGVSRRASRGGVGMKPSARLLGPFLEWMLGADFEAGVAKWKCVAEGAAR